MTDAILYEDEDEGSSTEPLRIPFLSNPELVLTGPRFFPWGSRQQVSRRSDGSYAGMLDAIIKVYVPMDGVDWNVFVKDPKSGSTVKLPRTEEVIDGFTRPRLRPEDVGHLALELGRILYPDIFAAGLFNVSAEGNSDQPETSTPGDNAPTPAPSAGKRR